MSDESRRAFWAGFRTGFLQASVPGLAVLAMLLLLMALL